MKTLAAVLLILSSVPVSAQDGACPGHLATFASDGTATRGSRDAVLDAVRRGAPIRVSWSLDPDRDGKPDLTHWADAGFVTEWQGHVFAQIADIQRQTPRSGQPRVDMPLGRKRWSGIVGTTGTLESHFDDDTPPTRVPVATTWCVSTCPAPSWRLAYQHDADGQPLLGRKEALVDAVRAGLPIRFAWGGSFQTPNGDVTVEHAAEPVFVSIMRGEVAAQLPEHIAQSSYFDPEKATFENASVMWRGLMSTTGSFDAVYVDRATGKEVRRLPQRARIAWFTLGSGIPACDASPQTLAVPGGVRRAR